MSIFNDSNFNEKKDHVFMQLKCAVKVDLAFGFAPERFEDGTCRYFYAHETNTVMEKSNLECTQDDVTNLKDKLQKIDIVDHCTRRRVNTN